MIAPSRSVHIGDSLPGFTVTPSRAQLFCFSAVTWNPHRIHYDAPYTKDVEGYSDVLVHGPLLGAFLMHMVEQWVSPWGRVESVTYRSTRPVAVGAALTVGGAVTTEGEDIEAELWIVGATGVRVCNGLVRAVAVAAEHSAGQSHQLGDGR